MIDLRMVADDRGNLQLQYRRRDISVDAGGNLCDGGDWLEWKSVPVVYDPSQLVDRIEVFDAKTSGAKPDGGLTREQVEKLLGKLAEDHATHLANARRADANNERYFDHQQGIADGIASCLGRIRLELSPQPDEPSVDDRVKIGMKVTTKTTSGEVIECTVIKQCTLHPGQWVLESPYHGYPITRKHSEFKPCK